MLVGVVVETVPAVNQFGGCHTRGTKKRQNFTNEYLYKSISPSHQPATVGLQNQYAFSSAPTRG